MRIRTIIKTLLILITIGAAAVIAAVAAECHFLCGKPPMRTVEVTIARADSEQFFKQIRIFADKYGFIKATTQSSPDPADVLVEMWRTDTDIISGEASEAGTSNISYDISIYAYGWYPIKMSETDTLVKGIQETFGQIKGAKIVVKK
jgi:hypothetical protein